MDRLYVLRVGKHLLCFEPVLLAVSVSLGWGLLMARGKYVGVLWGRVAGDLSKLVSVDSTDGCLQRAHVYTVPSP